MVENSSKSEKAVTLADSDYLEALTELANLRQDEKAFEWFCKRWPKLAYRSEHIPDESRVPPEISDEKLSKVPRKFWLIRERQDYLIQLWEGNTDILKGYLLPAEPPEEIQEKYKDREWDTQIQLDWQKGVIAYEARTEFQKALYTLFCHSALVKVCANPNCTTLPYFIAARATQRYCSEQCAEWFQRELKRRWWASNGNEWREKRAKIRKVRKQKKKSPTRKGRAKQKL